MLSSLVLALLAQALPPALVTLIFGGDVIPHEAVKYVAAVHAREGDDANNEGWDHVLGSLASALQRADFAVVNLESPIVVLKKPEQGEMIFSARPALLGAPKVGSRHSRRRREHAEPRENSKRSSCCSTKSWQPSRSAWASSTVSWA